MSIEIVNQETKPMDTKREDGQQKQEVRSVYIAGAKGVSFYGGFESFVQKLLQYHKDNKNLHYLVTCKANGEGAMDLSKLEGVSEVKDGRFQYCNADCFLIQVPTWLKSAQAIAYDVKSLKRICEDIEENKVQNPIVYVLACRIGPFFKRYVKKIHKLGGVVYLNPDGHEWMRAKWSAPVRKYWKESEWLMVKAADLVICDSVNIEKYIKKEYAAYHPQTTFIAYGSETTKSVLADDDLKFTSWLAKHGLKPFEYYMSCGRFVPENNFETMIREFMKSNTKKDFAIITTANDSFLNELEERLHFKSDSRIKFVGTVYDPELLKKIRENAYGYFHGHEVGGTNPSLLEALGSTDMNLLYDVGFNREVAEDAALYWSKEESNLAKLINYADSMTPEERKEIGDKAKRRIREEYSWEYICEKYVKVFRNS